MQPNDDFLMGELERQMENPFDFLGEYGRHMETVLNPSKAEDPLSKQLSMFEGICENQVIRPTVQQEEPATLPLSGPIRDGYVCFITMLEMMFAASSPRSAALLRWR